MRPDLQESAHLVTFTEEIFNEELHFWCSVKSKKMFKSNNKDTRTIREI